MVNGLIYFGGLEVASQFVGYLVDRRAYSVSKDFKL
jgi:hypothetical protein